MSSVSNLRQVEFKLNQVTKQDLSRKVKEQRLESTNVDSPLRLVSKVLHK